MPHTLIHITVEDYAKWRPVFDEIGALRQKYGGQGGHVFRKAEAPNEIMVLMEWKDMEQARQYAASDELRAAMQRAGVQGRPTIHYLNEAEAAAV